MVIFRGLSEGKRLRRRETGARKYGKASEHSVNGKQKLEGIEAGPRALFGNYLK